MPICTLRGAPTESQARRCRADAGRAARLDEQVRRKRVHIFVSFPAPLPVAAEALGNRFDVKIGDVSARIALPVADGDEEWPRLRADLSESDPMRSLVDGIANWGSQFNDSWQLNGALVSLLVAPGTHPGSSAEFARLAESFAAWFLAARRWVLAKLGIPAIGERPSPPTNFQGIFNGNVWGRGGRDTLLVTPGPVGATSQELGAAFQHAAAGDGLPIEHDLLVEAHTALLTNDLRRAVVDAATAAEVVLATWIRRHLEHHGLSEQESLALAEQANGIADLHRLANDLGLCLAVSRGRILDRIASPRNSAVHAGAEPTLETARRAHACARVIVDQIAPLQLP